MYKDIISAVTFVTLAIGSTAQAATIVNGGFNDQSGWTTANDAELNNPGGASGWTWNTPVVGSLLITSSEAVAPTEGSGFGITYAGLDSFSQSVNFATAGDYEFSVKANALVATSNIGTLINGAFKFFAGAASSSVFDVFTNDDWVTYTWTTTVAAGLLDVGLLNTESAQYAIAYDEFAINPVSAPVVPLPASALLLLGGMGGLAAMRRFRKN